MRPLTAEQVRGSFVNASASQTAKLTLPRLDEIDWDQIDHLGWRDAKAERLGYLVIPTAEGLSGVVLRTEQRKQLSRRASMCSLCLTVHPTDGVALFSAPRVGPRGRKGDTVGTWICADLQCGLYLRGVLEPDTRASMRETISLEAKVARSVENTARFVQRVLDS